jgi:16S rRNA processing protein RimM
VADKPTNLVPVGKIGAAYGIKGWLKIHSYTDPISNITGFADLQVARRGEWQPIKIDEWRNHGKGLVAHIKGCDDRNEASRYTGLSLAVSPDAMPALEKGEYYWHELEGLQVIANREAEEVLLGRVHHLMETGSNDVLVIRACEGSIDQRERLVPYLPGDVVLEIDTAGGIIRVDWDPAF